VLRRVLVISSFVVPVFADFFSRAGLEIPGPTVS
jgi:type II secretory pathway component PulF